MHAMSAPFFEYLPSWSSTVSGMRADAKTRIPPRIMYKNAGWEAVTTRSFFRWSTAVQPVKYSITPTTTTKKRCPNIARFLMLFISFSLGVRLTGLRSISSRVGPSMMSSMGSPFLIFHSVSMANSPIRYGSWPTSPSTYLRLNSSTCTPSESPTISLRWRWSFTNSLHLISLYMGQPPTGMMASTCPSLERWTASCCMRSSAISTSSPQSAGLTPPPISFQLVPSSVSFTPCIRLCTLGAESPSRA
mmetsp:Transcript_25086/g.73469  ORF Transcript_25086/g.73469 Transcript_25086/m.73469 type:complete len:247 (+) Transcript_25086:1375-2115(+)